MRTIYLRKEENGFIRKILIDMAYLSSHKLIRLPKYYFEDNLYLPYKKSGAGINIEKYILLKEKIVSEDNNFYYFNFPFKPDEVIDYAD